MNKSTYAHVFEQLAKLSSAQFVRANIARFGELNTQSYEWTENLLAADLCAVFHEQLLTQPDVFHSPELISKLTELMLTERVEQSVLSYFQSEYAIASFRVRHLAESSEENWTEDDTGLRCLTLRLYLHSNESASEHGKLLDKSTAEPLAHAHIATGTALLFAPQHIALLDGNNADHAVIEMLLIPSPYHWRYSKESVLPVVVAPLDLAEQAQRIIAHAQQKRPNANTLALFPPTNDITSAEQLRTFLYSIFPKTDFAWSMFTHLIALDPQLKQLNTLGALVETLKLSFQNSIDWSGSGRIGAENVENLMQLAEFEKRFDDSTTRYAKKGKPDPLAIFWPNPNPDEGSDRPALSRFEQLPFVKRYPLVNKATPIGSAGSCFAQEIAKVFQEEDYNYLVTERNDDPAAGIIVDNYTRGDKHAIACANYGILFNTPSFRQLAERAFGTRPTQKLLFQRADGLWLDPYRENVGFINQQAYLNDYDKHLAATRNALEQSDVFIITLGLNECWELHDGSVLSRNPHNQIYALAQHKTLTVQENVANIQAFFDTVKRHNPRFKLIISVSPVPFLATGHGAEQHVIAANCHSKSVLVVTAHELVNNNPDMYYLPSYELVTQCIKEPWADDDRHVKRDTVRQVVGLFKTIFTTEN